MQQNVIEELKNQITHIIEGGILKNIENTQLKNKVLLSFENKRVIKLILVGIEIILDLKFRGGITQQKDRFSKIYVKLFAQLPQPKDEIINYILFLVTYNIHWFLWKDNEYKEQITQRFVYDCYHIIIFYSNGLYVSDSYVKGQIDKIFTSKFQEYERIQDQIIQQKKLEQKRKAQEKTFLGRKLIFPSLSGDGQTFAKHLNEKLKPQKIQRKDSTKIDSFDDTTIQVSAQTKYLLSHLQLNVNQVSPSVKMVLHMNKNQVPFSRPKMLQHNFEKSDEKLKYGGLLNAQPQIQKKQDTKYNENLLDKFNLRAPPKEYYQKFSKVDPLFKEMLELNYVLNNHQESLQDLYSFKEMNQYELQLQQNIDSQSDQIKTQKTQYDGLDDASIQALIQNEVQQQGNQIQQIDNTQKNINEAQFIADQKSQTKQLVPLYQSKQKEYRQKYDRFIQSESTDNKISNIQLDLQKKQHNLMNHYHHQKAKRR